jgi:hypothetical protein
MKFRCHQKVDGKMKRTPLPHLDAFREICIKPSFVTFLPFKPLTPKIPENALSLFAQLLYYFETTNQQRPASQKCRKADAKPNASVSQRPVLWTFASSPQLQCQFTVAPQTGKLSISTWKEIADGKVRLATPPPL